MTLRTVLLHLAFALLFSPIFALKPATNAPLWDHLMEVNAQWEKQIEDRTPFMNKVTFESDADRIQVHLMLVESHLRNHMPTGISAEAKANRLELLDALSVYALQGEFPINPHHRSRTPYFIDHKGTACAVGHLLIESGHGSFAEQIRNEGNNAYIAEMKYPALPKWADSYGFTLAELAWIQPGYPFTDAWPSPITGGTSGPVTFIKELSNSGNLVVAGDFATAGGMAVDNAFIMTSANVVIPFSAGLVGTVHDVIEFGDNIWFGGEFSSNGGANLAVYDPIFETWTFEQLYTGVVHDLEVVNGKLYAGGDLTHSGGALVQHVMEYTGSVWTSVGLGLDAPVLTLATYNGELYAGGEFLNSGTNATPYVARWNGTEWVGVGTHNLGSPVRVLEEGQGKLWAGGNLMDATMTNAAFGLASIGTGDWEVMVDTTSPVVFIDPLNPIFPYVDNIQFNGTATYVSGKFLVYPFIGDYGTDIAQLAGTYLAPMVTPDSASSIHALAVWDNRFVIGGDLSNVNGASANNFAQKDIPLALAEELTEANMTVFPNPVLESATVSLPNAKDWLGVSMALHSIEGKKYPLDHLVEGNQVTIQRNNLPSGVYFLTLEKEGAVLTSKTLLLK